MNDIPEEVFNIILDFYGIDNIYCPQCSVNKDLEKKYSNYIYDIDKWGQCIYPTDYDKIDFISIIN